MVVEIQCPACSFSLRVDENMAGLQGKCPHCDAAFTVPSPAIDTASVRAGNLSKASPDEIVSELSRRGKSAVLVLFETPESGEYDLQALTKAKIRVFSTNEMDDATTLCALGHLGRIAQGIDRAKTQTPANTPTQVESSSSEVFELKGDPLGMTLADFQRKYGRKTGGMGLSLPWCSSDSPGQTIPALQSAPWHAKCGIVHARVDFPAENNSPTVAGVKTELLLYQFVDERLFRITASFDTDSFHLVREGITEKHGKPTDESADPMQFVWDNGPSYVHLVRGTIRPKKPSRLHYVHHQLQDEVDQRVPKVSDDL